MPLAAPVTNAILPDRSAMVSLPRLFLSLNVTCQTLGFKPNEFGAFPKRASWYKLDKSLGGRALNRQAR